MKEQSFRSLFVRSQPLFVLPYTPRLTLGMIILQRIHLPAK